MKLEKNCDTVSVVSVKVSKIVFTVKTEPSKIIESLVVSLVYVLVESLPEIVLEADALELESRVAVAPWMNLESCMRLKG